MIQFSLGAQLCPTLCDPMNHSIAGLPVHHQLPEFTQTHVYRVGDAIQPSHPLVPFSSCPQLLPASGTRVIIKVKFRVFSSLPLVSAPPEMINDLVDFLPIWLVVVVVSFICLFTLWKITFPTQKLEHFWKVIKAKFICWRDQGNAISFIVSTMVWCSTQVTSRLSLL